MEKSITVNSVSGGKSSAYIAAHYPSDIEIFSLVCADDPSLAHRDKKLMQMANDRLFKYSARWGEFIGTTEDPTILKTIFDLEQHIGREIIWVRGESFDSLIRRKAMIPNKFTRFCTEEMKLRPIFEYFYLYQNLEPVPVKGVKYSKERLFRCEKPVRMKIGYRVDEALRRETFSTEYKLSTQCATYGNRKMRNSIFRDWRVGVFPLIDMKKNIFHIQNYWKSWGVQFAEESNCNNCFHKPWQRLQQLYLKRPNLRQWTKSKEDRYGHTFHSEMSVDKIMDQPR